MKEQQWPTWHNGQWHSDDHAKISVHDFGLLRSYGIYEVITVKDNRVLALEAHLKRFFDGCRYYFIKIPYSAQDFSNAIATLYQKSGQDIHAWIVATRGTPQSYDLKDVLNAPPEFIVFATPYMPVNKGKALTLGISRKVRRIPSSSINQKFKNFARQDFTIAQIETSMKGFDFPLLLDHENFITEGPQFSVAIVNNGKVVTPGRSCLPGITMQVVKTLCQNNGLNFEYDDITEHDLYNAQDMFATSTAGGILPVMSVEDKQFVKSDIQQQIAKLYQDAWYQNAYSTQL